MTTDTQPSIEEQLAAERKLVANLQMQLDTLTQVLKKQDAYVVSLEADNCRLQNRILSVERIRGLHGDRVQFDMNVQQFMSWDPPERDDFIREAVIDAITNVLRHATRETRLQSLRARALNPQLSTLNSSLQ